MELGHGVGLIHGERLTHMRAKYKRIEELVKLLEKTSVNPKEMNGWLSTQHSAPLAQQVKVYQIVLRPEVKLAPLMQQLEMLGKIQSPYAQEVVAGAEIQIKYGRYLEKEQLAQRGNATIRKHRGTAENQQVSTAQPSGIRPHPRCEGERCARAANRH